MMRKMIITLDDLRDTNNPINDSFNKVLEDVRKQTNTEAEAEKLLVKRVVEDFVTHIQNNNTDKLNEEEEKKLVEVGNQICLVREKNEDKTQENKQYKNELGLETTPVMPMNFRQRIQALNGIDLKLIIQKKIYSTDLSPYHNRFSMPFCQIKDHNFLTDKEKQQLDGNKGQGIDNVLLIEPCMHESSELCLKKWNMNSELYVLTHKWNAVVTRNKMILKKDCLVQLWSFRCESKLCFALIRVADQQ